MKHIPTKKEGVFASSSSSVFSSYLLPQGNLAAYAQIKRSRSNAQSLKNSAHCRNAYAISSFHTGYLSLLHPYSLS